MFTKREIAEYLAQTEPSYRTGIQTRQYWVNAFMKMRKADLERRLERVTAPTFRTIYRDSEMPADPRALWA